MKRFDALIALTLAAAPVASRADDAGTPARNDVRADPAQVALARIDASVPPGGFAPDPAPIVTSRQWVVRFAYRSGEMYLRDARRISLPRPTATARNLGRFAIELYVGKELVDRVRFNFPLLGAEELGDESGHGSRSPRNAPPAFEPKLSSQMTVTLPDSDRATRAQLVDRATGTVWRLSWPLISSADAGTGP
jgi:hypothetical protein